MQVSIYALVDPTDGQPRYVGKTTGTLAKRLLIYQLEVNIYWRFNNAIYRLSIYKSC